MDAKEGSLGHLPARRVWSRHVLLTGLALLFVPLAAWGSGGNGLAASAAGNAPSSDPGDYYLALGDSIAYGMQPTQAKASTPPSAFHTGFVDVFAARLRQLSPTIDVVNYGCPGESTVTFVRGGVRRFATASSFTMRFEARSSRRRSPSCERTPASPRSR